MKATSSKAKSKPSLSATIMKFLPSELERQIEDVLDPDTRGGQEDSATGKLVRDWNEGTPFTPEHLPILLREARQLLAIIEDTDEWEQYEDQRRDRRELRAFIRRFSSRACEP